MRAQLSGKAGSFRRSGVRLMAVCMLLATSVAAQEHELGDAAWALPGIVHVGVAASGERRVATSGLASYGYTESQATGVSAHHRVGGSLAAGLAPAQWLELGLRLDGRYDWHPGEQETDSGLAGDPRFLVRAGLVASGQLRLGGGLGVWIPGKKAPSVAFDATTVDAKLLGAWTASGSSLTLAGLAGFRFDNSANSAADPARYSPADRVVLGLSEFHAVLLGFGTSLRIGSTELLWPSSVRTCWSAAGRRPLLSRPCASAPGCASICRIRFSCS